MIKYIPIVKSTGSELRAFENLEDDVKKGVTPLFELTKDRTHKTNYPEGRIEKALENILEVQPDDRFILDLTSHESLINSQIEELFNGNDGYRNWCSFIEDTDNADRIIPAIQIDAEQIDDNLKQGTKNVSTQAKRLESMCGSVLLRINLNFEPNEVLTYAEAILDGLKSETNLLVLFDAEYIKLKTASSYCDEIHGRAEQLKEKLSLNKFAVSASSFPKTVTSSEYGNDKYGAFPIEEIRLHEKLKKASDINWIYSDYGSIHPVRYNVKGGAWVPRVDVPLERSVFYHRYRRDDGGYKIAAQKAYADEDYEDVGAWGNKEIKKAATIKPGGMSPAFWISVRCNIHITTQAIRTGCVKR